MNMEDAPIKRCVILGAGGHACVGMDVLQPQGDGAPAVVLDNADPPGLREAA
jgi:hypothetical protein